MPIPAYKTAELLEAVPYGDAPGRALSAAKILPRAAKPEHHEIVGRARVKLAPERQPDSAAGFPELQAKARHRFFDILRPRELLNTRNNKPVAAHGTDCLLILQSCNKGK